MSTKRISWHCEDCEYLHLKDNIIAEGVDFVVTHCIVCKEKKLLFNPHSYKIEEEG